MYTAHPLQTKTTMRIWNRPLTKPVTMSGGASVGMTGTAAVAVAIVMMTEIVTEAVMMTEIVMVIVTEIVRMKDFAIVT